MTNVYEGRVVRSGIFFRNFKCKSEYFSEKKNKLPKNEFIKKIKFRNKREKKSLSKIKKNHRNILT